MGRTNGQFVGPPRGFVLDLTWQCSGQLVAPEEVAEFLGGLASAKVRSQAEPEAGAGARSASQLRLNLLALTERKAQHRGYPTDTCHEQRLERMPPAGLYSAFRGEVNCKTPDCSRP